MLYFVHSTQHSRLVTPLESIQSLSPELYATFKVSTDHIYGNVLAHVHIGLKLPEINWMLATWPMPINIRNTSYSLLHEY